MRAFGFKCSSLSTNGGRGCRYRFKEKVVLAYGWVYAAYGMNLRSALAGILEMGETDFWFDHWINLSLCCLRRDWSELPRYTRHEMILEKTDLRGDGRTSKDFLHDHLMIFWLMTRIHMDPTYGGSFDDLQCRKGFENFFG
ncbi:hypothetical protein V6N12_007017 [Hibiscus sabdariffa]|uniref:Uncharacterized protein n=1 Tax=Hibiscus sabdariffa TaxID=183260 RepID=A0ABR2F0K2_9ROSI